MFPNGLTPEGRYTMCMSFFLEFNVVRIVEGEELLMKETT